MGQVGEMGPAVARAGFLLAGGLLAMGVSGLPTDRGDACAATGAVCGDAEPHRLNREQNAEILLFGERLDVNRASPVALEALPAIGPRRAQAIVNERERRLFSGIADLSRVRGIGLRTVEEIGPWVEALPTGDREVHP